MIPNPFFVAPFVPWRGRLILQLKAPLAWKFKYFTMGKGTKRPRSGSNRAARDPFAGIGGASPRIYQSIPPGTVVRAPSGALMVSQTQGARQYTETKYFSSQHDANFVTSNDWSDGGCSFNPSTGLSWLTPGSGSGPEGRIGNKIFVKSVRLRGQVGFPKKSNESAIHSADVVRLILFIDQQTNGAVVGSNTLMHGASAGNRAVHTFQSVNHMGRFRVLWDKTFALNTLAAAVYNPGASSDVEHAGFQKVFKANIKFAKPIEVMFNGDDATTTVANIVKNGFQMAANASSIGLVPAATVCMRFAYTDK